MDDTCSPAPVSDMASGQRHLDKLVTKIGKEAAEYQAEAGCRVQAMVLGAGMRSETTG